jgi:Ala-tRNA(Pro) deacylase
MQNFDPALLQFFQTHDLSHQYFEHPPVFTVDECQDIKNTIPGFHTKNLFLTDKKWGFYLVSIEADKRFPVNLFRKSLGLKDLSFWSPEQLFELLKLTPWSVSLFGLIHAPTSLSVFLDHDLRHAPHVWRHPNRNDATIVIDHDTLEKFLVLTGHTPKTVQFDENDVQIYTYSSGQIHNVIG